MTGIAIQVGWNMISFFTRCYIAIMATATDPPYFIVIHFGGRAPTGFSMTTFAQITAAHMLRALAFGGGAIMTGATGR